MKIYFAGPLFNSAEQAFNLKLTNTLEKMGYEVFLPQRDGAEKDKHQYENMSKEERRNAIFTIDRDKILESDIFLFILDGRVPDEGACVELGMAYTQKYLQRNQKKLIGLQTDNRAVFLGSKLNPMLRVSLDQILSTEDQLIELLGNKNRLQHL